MRAAASQRTRLAIYVQMDMPHQMGHIHLEDVETNE